MPGRKMHADEVHTDVRLVRRLLAAQFPQWVDLPVRPVPSAGTDNALYRLGDDMVVRLPRIHRAVAAVHKEHEWLPRLAPQLPFAIPMPLDTGVPAAGYPWHWSVYRWLEGENPTVGRLEAPGLLAQDLARFVTALQRIEPTGGPPADRGVPLAMRDIPTRTAIEALDGMVDTDAVTAAWHSALQIPAWTGPPVWVHTDLSPGNLLLVAGRLRAVIDFSGLGVGDPACDLIVAWNLLPPDARDAFRAGLDPDDATWSRGRGWALSVALVQLPYYRDSNPVLAANARHVIEAVLADHAPETGTDLVFAVDDPRADDVRALLLKHLGFARAVTPPGHVHALDVDGLLDPALTLFSVRRGGALLGVGALRRIDASHAELKSMHVDEAARGHGVGRALVDQLLAAAADRGYGRVSLETGTMDAFTPARRLYESVGFTPCPPFGEYTANPDSTCMTVTIETAAAGSTGPGTGTGGVSSRPAPA